MRKLIASRNFVRGILIKLPAGSREYFYCLLITHLQRIYCYLLHSFGEPNAMAEVNRSAMKFSITEIGEL
jgi:hypothetical protein